MKKSIFLAAVLTLALAIPALATSEPGVVAGAVKGDKQIVKTESVGEVKRHAKQRGEGRDCKDRKEKHETIRGILDANMPAIRDLSDKLDEKTLLLESVSSNPNTTTAYIEALVKEVADLNRQMRDKKETMEKEIGDKIGHPVRHNPFHHFGPCE